MYSVVHSPAWDLIPRRGDSGSQSQFSARGLEPWNVARRDDLNRLQIGIQTQAVDKKYPGLWDARYMCRPAFERKTT